VFDIGRREFIALLGGAAAYPFAARAQQAQGPASERVRRVGVLITLEANDPEGESELKALKWAFQELGWVDGRNLQLEIRWSGGEPVRIQASAKELVTLPCEVIVARSTPAVAALIKETRTIPIVFAYVVDPMGSGFVQSFPRPGGNVTGFQTYEFTFAGKWLQLLMEAVPSVRRVGLIHNPATAPPGFLLALEALPPSPSVQLIRAPVHNAAEIGAVIAEFAREPGGGLIIMPDTFNDANHEEIVVLAAKYGLPAVYTHRFDDGLICYGPDLSDVLRRTAPYVDRILRGEKPGELPVQAPTKYELVINLKIANALGVTIPPSLLAIADDILQ
jgi:putative tryptophan/tyrosine transport system substrate-binding protein